MLIKKNTVKSDYINLYSLNKEKIGIPIFQRFYDWKEKEIIQLKEDLLNLIDNKDIQLYLLDFIYYKEDVFFKIADGQQRIVTINNLILAIQNVAYDNNIKIDEIRLFDISYDVSSNDEKYKDHFNKYPKAPFKKVYLDFYKFIKNNINRINDFIDIIKNNIYVFIKKCDNPDDAFKIFQQINTGGKPLTKDEVIKTALDQYSLQYDIRIETNKIKDIRQSLLSYYKFTSNNYEKNFDNMEIITFLKENVTKNKDTFLNFVNTIQIFNETKDNPFKYVVSYINRNTIMDVLNILSIKKIRIDNDLKYRNKVIIPLCMMSIILTLNGGSPTNFRYLLNEVISKIKNSEKPEKIGEYLIEKINNDSTTWTIRFDDFKNKLGDISTPRSLKKALLIIDVICRNVSGFINVDSINLEHIYPQKPDFEWSEKGWPSSSNEQKELIDNIGNYLLLSAEINKKIQNKYITLKIERYKEIMAKDNILNTQINNVNFSYFIEKQKLYIFERQNNIAKLIQDTFPFGRVLIK